VIKHQWTSFRVSGPVSESVGTGEGGGVCLRNEVRRIMQGTLKASSPRGVQVKGAKHAQCATGFVGVVSEEAARERTMIGRAFVQAWGWKRERGRRHVQRAQACAGDAGGRCYLSHGRCGIMRLSREAPTYPPEGRRHEPWDVACPIGGQSRGWPQRSWADGSCGPLLEPPDAQSAPSPPTTGGLVKIGWRK
jgi:hypothetical protein